MEFMEAVLKRRTYRGHFTDKPISQKDLDFIIEAARWSPSPFNIQPWEILIVKEQKSKDALADLVSKSMAAQMGDGRFLQDVSQWMSLTRDEWANRGEGVMIDDHVDVPGFIKDQMYGGITMLSNYLRVAVRHMKRQKINSAISIAGGITIMIGP